MSRRDWVHRIALGGLALAGFAAAMALTWVYASPEPPEIPRQSAYQAPSEDYLSGGYECRPERLSAMPARKREAEKDRCSATAEQRREEQESLAQARRSTELAEQGVLQTWGQARTGFAQTLATVAAFAAAVWAAWAASRAAVYAKHAADAAAQQLEAHFAAETASIVLMETTKNSGFTLWVANLGRTPATIGAYIIEYFSSDPEYPPSTAFVGEPVIIRVGLPATGEFVACGKLPPPGPEITMVVGWVTTLDAFRRETVCWFRYDLDGDKWSMAANGKWRLKTERQVTRKQNGR